MLATEIFQLSSEQDMVTHPSASRWLKTKASNMLVCNTEVSAGVETLWVNMERDQTVNVT
jgi:hypothetical protein